LSSLHDFVYRGKFSFNYYIRGESVSEQVERTLTFNSIDLRDAFQIGTEEIDVNNNKVEVFIKNKVNHNFNSVKVDFDSVFFEFSEEISLDSFERKNFSVDLNEDDIDNLKAGFYTLNAVVEVNEADAEIEGTIKFPEEDNLKTEKSSSGFFISVDRIKKINDGNVDVLAREDVERNIFTRLFTSFEPEPDAVDREDLTVIYTWVRKLDPGEEFEIEVRTNWMLPFFVVLFIVAIVVFAKRVSKTDLILKKKVSFVRAKGGEFALKVILVVKAENYVENVSITDRLPRLAKVYPRFGKEQPSKVDEKGKKIEWSFNVLDPGEVRVMSYIIYSKVGVLGKFALPIATAIYDREGNIREASSNRTYFVSEVAGGGEEE
jgi:hypothetical protein